MTKRVFVSHSHADHAAVDTLKRTLEAAGHTVWVSRYDLGPNDPFPPAIARAIVTADALLFYQTHNSNKSDWVRSELLFAQHNRVPIIALTLASAASNSPISFILTQAKSIIQKGTKRQTAFFAEAKSAVSMLQRTSAPVVAMLNIKGGVGKSTLAANLFFAMAAEQSKRILLIDIDPQHNLSQMIFNANDLDNAQKSDNTILSAFEPSLATGATTSPSSSLHNINVENIDPPPPAAISVALNHENLKEGQLALVPAQIELLKYTMWDKTPEALNRCKFRFHQFIADCRRQYDLVVIDCNPSISFLTACALEAASHVLAPVTADTFSIQGLRAVQRVNDTVFGVQNKPALHVIINNVPKQTVPEAEKQVRTNMIYGPLTLKNRIQSSEYMKTKNLDEAPLNSLDTLALNKRGPFAQDIHTALRDAANEYAEIIFGAKP